MIKDENNAIIKVGYSCNNNCCFCHEEGNSINFSIEEIKKRVLEAKNAGAKLILLSGGEPTIRPDIPLIISFIKENGISPAVITNGRMLYYRKNAKKLKKAGLSLAYLTLNGHSKELHDLHTQAKGSFVQAIAGIKNLVKLNLRVIVRVIITKENKNYLKETIELINNLGVEEIEFALVSPMGRGKKNFKYLNPGIIKASKKIQDAVFYSQIKGIKAYVDGVPQCLMGRFSYVKERFGGNMVYKFVSPEIDPLNIQKGKNKSKLPECNNCSWYSECEGLHEEYKKECEGKIKARENMLLVNPPIHLRGDNRDNTFTHPTGLLRIGAHLLDQGYDVDMLDCMYYNGVFNHSLTEIGELKCGNYENEKIKKKVYHFGKTNDEFRKELKSKEEPDEIYVTCCLTFNWQPAHKIIEICKEVYPNAKVKFGGVYPTLCPEHAKKSKADEIIVGHYGEAHKFPPAYQLMKQKPGYAIIELVRGCPNNCKYCAQKHIDPEVRFREVNDVINEIKLRIKEYGINDFVILDPNVNQNPEHFKNFLDEVIKNNLNINLKIPAGFQHNKIDLDLAKKMRVAGVTRINLSLESMNPILLEKLNRYNTEKVKFEETINTLAKAGYDRKDIKIFVMVCVPGQDISTVIDTIIFILGLGCSFDISAYTPVPKTAMYNENLDLINEKGLESLAPQFVPFATNEFRVKDVEFLRKMIKARNVNEIIENAKNENPRVYELFSKRLNSKNKMFLAKGCAL